MLDHVAFGIGSAAIAGLQAPRYADRQPDRMKKLQDNVEFRCPVMNLLRSAGVELGVTWDVEPAEKPPS